MSTVSGMQGKSIVTTDRSNGAFCSLAESSANGIERNSFLNWQNQTEVTIFMCQLERARVFSLLFSLHSRLFFIYTSLSLSPSLNALRLFHLIFIASSCLLLGPHIRPQFPISTSSQWITEFIFIETIRPEVIREEYFSSLCYHHSLHRAAGWIAL